MAQHAWWSLLSVLLFAIAITRSDGKCAMTQTCVNPGNIPDYDACIPEAHREPVDPQPMVGPQWANVTGGGSCTTDADCSSKGDCTNGVCVCRDIGLVAGAHCELFAIQCPEYKDSACCSWQQNQGMAENFKLLVSVFGKNSGGGCDACAANLLNLWCGLVCAPHQADFVHMHLPFPSTSYRPDPMTGAERVKVLELDVTLDKAFTCRVFDSCKHTAIASMSEGMKSSLGFLNYQVQTGAIGHGEYMHLHFAQASAPESTTTTTTTTMTIDAIGTRDNSDAAFVHHVFDCSNYSEVATVGPLLPQQAQLLPSIAQASALKQCPCGACRATCDARSSDSDAIAMQRNPIALFDGFNNTLVALVYGALVAIVLLLRRGRQRD